jgi:tripartite motif-containing protein 71
MRFQHTLRHGAIGVLTFFVVMLSIMVFPVAAQTSSDTTLEATAAVAAPLTQVWQTTFTPETALSSPGDIAIDSDGNVYVSTQSMNTVKKFDKDGNFIKEWGGHGKGDGQFSLSLGVGVDADNNVYVTDFYNIRIQKFDSDGTFLKQWPNQLTTSPAFLAVDTKGNVYVNEFPPHTKNYVQKFDTDGNLIVEWGNENKTFAGRTEDIAVDPDGNLYVCDPLKHRVQKLDPDGNLIATFGADASRDGNGLFDDPFSVSVDGEGNIYILDSHFLQKLDWQGNFVAQWSTAAGTDLEKASNVAVDGTGNIYVFARGDVTTTTGKTTRVPVLKKFQQDEG